MGVVKQAEIFWLGSIVGADLTRLDLELGLSQSPSPDQFRICRIG